MDTDFWVFSLSCVCQWKHGCIFCACRNRLANTAVTGNAPDLCFMVSNEIMHASSGTLNMFEQFSFFSGSCVYIHIWWHLECDKGINPLFVCSDMCMSIGQVFPRKRPVLFIGHTMSAHIWKSLMVVLRPGGSHIEQTVMRKRITVFHQQLSPAAPVSIKCTYIAAGHAVAKELLVSKQKLAEKTSPKLIQEIECRWSWFQDASIFNLWIVHWREITWASVKRLLHEPQQVQNKLWERHYRVVDMHAQCLWSDRTVARVMVLKAPSSNCNRSPY